MSEHDLWELYDPSAEDVYNAAVARGPEFAEQAANSFGDCDSGLNRARANHAEKMQAESSKYVNTPRSGGLLSRIFAAIRNK